MRRKTKAHQVDGDRDPFDYGGVFAVIGPRDGDDTDIALIRVERIAELIGEEEALEYESPFWVGVRCLTYKELVDVVEDDAVLEQVRRIAGSDAERPEVKWSNLKAMLHYYIWSHEEQSFTFEREDEDVLRHHDLRGFRGDALGRELRRTIKEHTLSRLRVRYKRQD